MFPAGSTTAAVNITIQSDNIVEGTEIFTATISTFDTGSGFFNVIAGDDDMATITIQEDACAYHCMYMSFIYDYGMYCSLLFHSLQ